MCGYLGIKWHKIPFCIRARQWIFTCLNIYISTSYLFSIFHNQFEQIGQHKKNYLLTKLVILSGCKDPMDPKLFYHFINSLESFINFLTDLAYTGHFS